VRQERRLKKIISTKCTHTLNGTALYTNGPTQHPAAPKAMRRGKASSLASARWNHRPPRCGAAAGKAGRDRSALKAKFVHGPSFKRCSLTFGCGPPRAQLGGRTTGVDSVEDRNAEAPRGRRCAAQTGRNDQRGLGPTIRWPAEKIPNRPKKQLDAIAPRKNPVISRPISGQRGRRQFARAQERGASTQKHVQSGRRRMNTDRTRCDCLGEP